MDGQMVGEQNRWTDRGTDDSLYLDERSIEYREQSITQETISEPFLRPPSFATESKCFKQS